MEAGRKVFDVVLGLRSRLLFLETEARDLRELRESMTASFNERARIATELRFVELAIAHYCALLELEGTLARGKSPRLAA